MDRPSRNRKGGSLRAFGAWPLAWPLPSGPPGPTWGTMPLAKITFEGLTQRVARLSVGGLGPSG
jgi:hypothetical protein